MLNAPTLEKLHALKLDALAAAWTEQQHQADMTALAFDERLGLLVEAEWLARENKRLIRALQEAKLKLAQACIEAIDYPARRELDKAVIRQLATCRWVEEHHNVILVGATGTGKSVSSPARLRIRPAARAIVPGTAAPRASFTSSPWPGPMAPTSACSPSSTASMSSSSIHVEPSVMWSRRGCGAAGSEGSGSGLHITVGVTALAATRGWSRFGARRDGGAPPRGRAPSRAPFASSRGRSSHTDWSW
jgi:IstB-like ATP binding protein